ncbi:hypothetical protein NDU88_008117 [Pleurodeles waltl]|uniref:Uncharacterized protein n=1 Tax=Pleurodeles waltl TaxID=8319 RepID=A0AAV7U385_PLEWA|nr:hypothetical protein NDU88_008117 [Pleurodeles waltl]
MGEGGRRDTQRRGEKPHRCSGLTPRGLPLAKGPRLLTSAALGCFTFLSPGAQASGAPPLRSLVTVHPSRLFVRPPLLCGPAQTRGSADDPRTRRTPQGFDLPVGSALQNHFSGSESELLT